MATSGCAEAAQAVLALGNAELEAKQDQHGCTALHVACFEGNPWCVCVRVACGPHQGI